MKCNYCSEPFESLSKKSNQSIKQFLNVIRGTESLIFNTRFYVNISVETTTFLLKFCFLKFVSIYHVYKCLLNTCVRTIGIWGDSHLAKVFNSSYFMVILKGATWHTKRENPPVITRSQKRKLKFLTETNSRNSNNDSNNNRRT